MEIIFIWGILALFVVGRIDDKRVELLEHKIIDIAWTCYLPKNTVKILVGIILIIISPYLFFIIITKPFRKSSD